MKKIIFLCSVSLLLLTACNEIIPGFNNDYSRPMMPQAVPVSTVSTDMLKNPESVNYATFYYYNEKSEKYISTNFSCEARFVVPTTRKIVASKTPLDTIFNELFKADLSQDEIDQGFIPTPFKTHDFSIKSLNFTDGVLTIDLNNNTVLESLSSCEMGIFSAIVEKTASQFSEIKEVKFNSQAIESLKL
jgi:hypothetical protein